MSGRNVWKGHIKSQSEFDHHYACWASNHRGWAKMKKLNKKLAKRRMKQAERRDGHEYHG